MPSNAMDTEDAIKPKVDNRPWVERYRPVNLDAVSHQAHVVAVLKNAVATGRLPHLLLYGPPGSGKTSVALALCRQLWSPTEWKRRVLELNASDERGISVVREKIKQFASFSVSKPPTKSAKSFFTKDNKSNNDASSSSSYPNPAFKIIILDEADTVTKDAQSALRRIIEATSHSTRFILICNYVTRIIAPLGSRCAKFRFAALPADAMRERLCAIAQAEHEQQMRNSDSGADDTTMQDETATNALVDSVLQHAGGDMRKAVMLLQSLHSLGGGGATTDVCSDEVVADICGVPPKSVSETVWNELCAAPTFAAVQRCLEDYCAAGYAARACLTHWLERLEDEDSSNELLSEVHKSDVAIRIAEAEANMIQGADEGLQLLTVGSLLHECLKEHKKVTAAASN